MLYLEDLNLNDVFESRCYTITLAEILEFAERYDPQVFHTDPKAAEKHPIFQGLAASGWHTAAVVMRLWTECFPIACGLIGSESNLRWLQPTRANDEIRVKVRICDIQPSKRKSDRGIVSYETQALNQKDEIFLQSLTKILVFKRELGTN